jgi:MATE family multidrug resistance protein
MTDQTPAASSQALPETTAGWHRRVWKLTWPMVISNLSIPLLGAVDTAVVGHLDEPTYLGAVAVGAVIFNFIYWGFGFLKMSTTGFTAQAHGAGDADEVRATLARALGIALVLALAVLALQIPLGLAALYLFEASAGVETLTGVYFEVRIWSAPAALANYVILGCFLGTQNPRAALLHLVCLNGVNIILDIAFVAGFGWGVAGVAAASVIAEYAALLLGAVLLARILRRIGGTWVRERILALAQLRRTLRAHGDIFIRTLCLLLAFGVFTAQGAKLGDVTLAANAILLNFQSFTAFALDGIAHAAEALVGGAFGARNRAALRSAVAISTLWAVVIAVAMTAVYAAGGTAIIGLLTSLADVRAVAAEHLIWAIALPLVSVWSYQLDGIYIGATRTAAMRNGMALSLAAYGVAMWLVFPAWGNHGLWFAFVVFMVARAITLAFWYPALERSLPATPSPAR